MILCVKIIFTIYSLRKILHLLSYTIYFWGLWVIKAISAPAFYFQNIFGLACLTIILAFSLSKPKILVRSTVVKCIFLILIIFIFTFFKNLFPAGDRLDTPRNLNISIFTSKLKILAQLDSGKVIILTMRNDVAHFTVIKREVARSYKRLCT